MLLNDVDNLKDFKTMVGALEAIEGEAGEMLDDLLIKVDIEQWCYILEKEGKVSSGKVLWKLVQKSKDFGDITKVITSLGIDTDKINAYFPLDCYLLAFYFISTEEKRKYIYNKIKEIGGTKDADYTDSFVDELLEPISDETLKACESWKCDM